jgi:hypothetical protein
MCSRKASRGNGFALSTLLTLKGLCCGSVAPVLKESKFDPRMNQVTGGQENKKPGDWKNKVNLDQVSGLREPCG